MIDCHTHSRLSHDGNYTVAEMVAKAKSMGLSYYAITDHLDRDYLEFAPDFYQLDPKKLAAEVAEAKEGALPTYLALGVECGYSESACNAYLEELPQYPFDIILNSVHAIGNTDVYYPVYFEGKTKTEAYAAYFDRVLNSVNAPYPYDVISHLGYVVRNAPYVPKTIAYDDYRDILDRILKRIIDLGKCLEVNANVVCETSPFCPNAGILARYRELGGDLISFGSDAHRTERIALNFNDVTEYLKEMGFTHYTVFKQRKPFDVAF